MTPHVIMVAAGHRWYAENSHREAPQFGHAPRVMPGAIFTENEEADDLNMYMVDAAEDAGHLVTDVEFNKALIQVLHERATTSVSSTTDQEQEP